MKRLVLITFYLALLVGPVRAQEVPPLSSVEISLWPEFDRPEMLVIYSGLFAAGTSPPSPVEIRIPASVGSPTAVAYISPEGQLLNQQYTTRVEGDSLVISFELAAQGFHVEYYAPLAIDEAGRRSFTFEYTADYAVETLALKVQVPPTSENYMLEPEADSVAEESDGLVYHRATVGPLAPGETRTWTVSYDKSGEALTNEIFAQEESQAGAPGSGASGEDNTAVLLFAVAFVALVAVGGAAFWLGKQTQAAPEPVPQQRSERRGSGRGAGAAVFFCHQCGAQLRADAEFCHKCGAEVRE